MCERKEHSYNVLLSTLSEVVLAQFDHISISKIM